MTSQILLLNADFRAIRVLSLKRALSLLLKDRVDIVESVPGKKLRSPSTEIDYPSVIRLRRFVRVPDRKATWSRRAVFSRDHYTCQYCGRKLDRDEATLDHIIPVSECKARGIRASTFSNSCCSCVSCNTKKGSRNMRDAGLRFFDQEFEPKIPRVSYLIFSGDVPESWRVYIRS